MHLLTHMSKRKRSVKEDTELESPPKVKRIKKEEPVEDSDDDGSLRVEETSVTYVTEVSAFKLTPYSCATLLSPFSCDWFARRGEFYATNKMDVHVLVYQKLAHPNRFITFSVKRGRNTKNLIDTISYAAYDGIRARASTLFDEDTIDTTDDYLMNRCGLQRN